MKRKSRREEPAPHEVAVRLASLLPEPNALIGALAVAAHGYVRATDAVVFISPAAPREIRERLAKGGIAGEIRRGDALEGDVPSVVSGSADGVRFDVLYPPVPIDWSRTVLLPLEGGSRLRVVDLDTLVRLELRAGGPQDLVDVVHLVRLHSEIETRALFARGGLWSARSLRNMALGSANPFLGAGRAEAPLQTNPVTAEAAVIAARSR
jgi:hypothetical protein